MMADHPPRLGADHVLLADRFGLLASVLILAFAAALAAAILPLQILSPAWQYNFTGVLIDNTPVALLGFAFLHLAVYLDPDNPSLQRRRRRLGRVAIAAVLMFPLLIPLQGYILWRGTVTSSQIQANQRSEVNRELNDLSRILNQASNTKQLIATLPPAVTQTLDSKARQLPLPQLRQRLQTDFLQARNQLNQGIELPAKSNVFSLWKRSLRIILSSLLFAIGFSAFGIRQGSEFSLLQEWELGWRPWILNSQLQAHPKPIIVHVQSSKTGVSNAGDVTEEDYEERLIP